MSKRKVLNSTILKLGFISFFADFSSEMLYPITPIFLTSILGASMTTLGLIEGTAEAIASLLKTYSGYLSDRSQKRKPFIVLGYLLAAICKPFIGLSSHWTHVLFARSTDRLGKGFRGAPRDALLSESTNSENRAEAFGWHRMMDTLGAAIGPLVAIAFLKFYEGAELRNIYFWALIPGLMAVALTLSLKDKLSDKDRAKKTFEFKWSLLTPQFKKFLTLWTLFSLINSSDVFLILKAKNSGLSTIEVILIYCFYNLFYAFLSPVAGKLADRTSKKKVISLSLIVFAMTYLGMSFATEKWHFWVLFAIYGFYMAGSDGVGKAMAIDLIDGQHKATAIGILGTFTGLALIIASSLTGFIWDHWGSSVALSICALGAISVALGFSLFNFAKVSE